MPLTLRPTAIGTPPAFQHLKDYCVFEDGEKIGHIYEVHAARSPEQAWPWSVNHRSDPEPDRRPHQWPRRDLRGREGAVSGTLV